MANDATFNQSTGGNYRRMGGDHWTVGGRQNFLSGSSCSFESGSNVDFQSGSTINMAGTLNMVGTFRATGAIDLSTAGAYLKGFMEDGTTTADLKAYGCSVLTKSSGLGNQVYTMQAPIIGVTKELAVIMADSSDKVIVDMASNSATIKTYTGQTLNQLVFATSGATNNWAGGITLKGYTTSVWIVVGQSGTIATTS